MKSADRYTCWMIIGGVKINLWLENIKNAEYFDERRMSKWIDEANSLTHLNHFLIIQ